MVSHRSSETSSASPSCLTAADTSLKMAKGLLLLIIAQTISKLLYPTSHHCVKAMLSFKNKYDAKQSLQSFPNYQKRGSMMLPLKFFSCYFIILCSQKALRPLLLLNCNDEIGQIKTCAQGKAKILFNTATSTIYSSCHALI